MKGSFKKGSFKTVSITDKDLFNMHTNYRIFSPHTLIILYIVNYTPHLHIILSPQYPLQSHRRARLYKTRPLLFHTIMFKTK